MMTTMCHALQSMVEEWCQQCCRPRGSKDDKDGVRRRVHLPGQRDVHQRRWNSDI